MEEKLERIAVALESIQNILAQDTSKPCVCPTTFKEIEDMIEKPQTRKKVKEVVEEDIVPELPKVIPPSPPEPPKVSIVEESYTFEETVAKIRTEVDRLKAALGKEGCEKAVVKIFDKVQKDATRLTQIDPEKYKLAVEEFQKYGR